MKIKWDDDDYFFMLCMILITLLTFSISALLTWE